MLIDNYLTDEQDPKIVEKVLGKLKDMLTSDEKVIYLAIQKKPAVTLFPDCIAVTNKQIIFYIPENLGLTTNYKTFIWSEVKEVSFKEEFFGSKFIAVPQKGENIAVDFIPKVQARKLYQFSNEQLQKEKEIPGFEGKTAVAQNELLAEDYSSYIENEDQNTASSTVPKVIETEDELTQALFKLKTLYEKQLISKEEYELKKAEILKRL